MPKIQSISVVMPVYNEENNLYTGINVIYKYLTKLVGNNFEILIIENGSTDNTANIAKKLEIKYSNVKSFILTTPSWGEACRYGISHAKYDMVTFYPADLTFSLDFIGQAYKILDKYPVILGVRYNEKSKVERPLIRIIISKIHTILVNILFNSHYNDVNCIKAFRTDIGKKIFKYTIAKGPFIEVELIYLIQKTRINFFEIPINHIEKELARHPLYIVRSIFKNFINLFIFKLKNIKN